HPCQVPLLDQSLAKKRGGAVQTEMLLQALIQGVAAWQGGHPSQEQGTKLPVHRSTPSFDRNRPAINQPRPPFPQLFFFRMQTDRAENMLPGILRSNTLRSTRSGG